MSEYFTKTACGHIKTYNIAAEYLFKKYSQEL